LIFFILINFFLQEQTSKETHTDYISMESEQPVPTISVESEQPVPTISMHHDPVVLIKETKPDTAPPKYGFVAKCLHCFRGQ